MTKPTILIVLDGLRYDCARLDLGYMEALVRAGDAQVYKVDSQLPSISRPLYETLMTGLPPVEHGVVSNAVVRLSERPNVFSLARSAGLKTAAAAYSWFFELYNRAPFTPDDRRIEHSEGGIQFGSFYWDDTYPDSHLFADAHDLVLRYRPDFMVLHSMNIDDTGHRHGGASPAYRNAARMASHLLALAVPRWRALGYTVLVTSDHGMSDDGNHGGTHPDEATVAFYTIGTDQFTCDAGAPLQQTEIAGLICELLAIRQHGLPVPSGILRAQQA